MIARPAADEYSPYYDTYISKVPEGNVVDILRTQLHESARLLEQLTETQAAYRYAPGKWSLREVIGHLCDAERIFAYRILCIARGETAPLPGFDEDSYARVSNVETRPMRAVTTEFAHIRAATIALVEGLDEAAIGRRGNANGKLITPRALAYIIAGHERHHMGVIRERYLR
ncbi:MAG TPA: DinB family protein [Gemmatimonadales bacterium]|nr:DinB family protein [Gemmatimonadales bacterium]